MDQTEKLLIGIEHVLSLASDLVDEVARLKSVEEECKMLKEKVFMNQLTQAEQEVFALAIDGHSISEIQNLLHKEESTIKNQRKSILKKLNTESMTDAVQQFQNLHEEPSEKIIRIS
ncbi:MULTISPECIES: response regulator transcription factor [Priestia]|nr:MULTISPECIES: helix-turn-helix transcriptional regulator [Priestia]MCW1049156.1 helix-turn-helix transcriptional regulator [Priestia sp. JV24]MEB4856940.1 helix-turn-helix transcriptional regulator [Priestia megaterium]MED3819116.1 helix-turn-helix transcriptional regulator [Priestia aryabhattai]